MTVPHFSDALAQGLAAVHKDARFSRANGFTVTESPLVPNAYRVEGEAWTFYLVHSPDGWAYLGWMEAAQQGLSF